MDRKRAKELLPIIQAFAEGKAIQWRGSQSYGHWLTVNRLDDISDAKGFEYRIKPEPRDWWINEYKRGETFSYENRELADKCAGPGRIRCIHVREVLDDENVKNDWRLWWETLGED